MVEHYSHQNEADKGTRLSQEADEAQETGRKMLLFVSISF